MAIQFSCRLRPSPEAVLRLYRFAHWAKDRKLREVRRMLEHTPLIATAWDGKLLVGMARCNSDMAFRAVLWDVIVDPDYLRRGLGTRLVRLLLAEPALKGVESVWLSTTDKHAFYTRLGFRLNRDNIMVLKRKSKAS